MAYSGADWATVLVRYVERALAGTLPTSRTRSSQFTSGHNTETAMQASVGTTAVKVQDADTSSVFREVKNLGTVNVFRGTSSAVTAATGYPILPSEAFTVPDDAEVWLIAATGTVTVGRSRA